MEIFLERYQSHPFVELFEEGVGRVWEHPEWDGLVTCTLLVHESWKHLDLRRHTAYVQIEIGTGVSVRRRSLEKIFFSSLAR